MLFSRGPGHCPGGRSKAVPVAVVRLKSIDGLLEDIQYLAKAIGKDEEAKQLLKLVEVGPGGQALNAFDRKRPLGLYTVVGKELTDTSAVGMFPIADEKALLKALEQLNMKPEKDDDGVYTVQPASSPVPAYFRIANKYAYVTALNKSAIDKDKLLTPGDVLPAKETAMLAVIARIDQIPKEMKQQILEQFEKGIEEAKKNKPDGETEQQEAARLIGIEESAESYKAVLLEGESLEARLDLDHKSGELSVAVSVSAVAGSKLASQIAESAAGKSLFVGLPGKGSAVNGLLHFTLSEKMRQVLSETAQEAAKKELAKEKDKVKRELGEKALAAIMPSLKSGELDMAFDLRGSESGKLFTAVFGIKVKDGAGLEKVLRDLVKEAPEADKKKVNLDVAKVGEVAIHRLEIAGEMDAKAQAIFGKNAEACFAIRSDAILFALGDKAESALKEALSLKPQTTQPFVLEASLTKVAPLLEEQHPGVVKVAEEAFGTEKGKDRVRLSVEGGKTSKLQLTVSVPTLKFLAALIQERASNK
jgi:hypothetical protein